MPRKRSSKGRARPVTPKSKLLLEIEKANRKLRSLEKGGEYGKYASKSLLRLVVNEKSFSYKRGRRNKIRLRTGKIETPQVRIYMKKFGEFLHSATSSLLGIASARRKAQKKLKKTLGGLVDRKVTDEDLDEFYDLVNDKDFKYISDKIGDSEAYVLVQSIKEKSLTKEQFKQQFAQFFDTNNVDFGLRAERLFNKFVKSYIPFYNDNDFEFISKTMGERETIDFMEKAKEKNMTLDQFRASLAPYFENTEGAAFQLNTESLYRKMKEM